MIKVALWILGTKMGFLLNSVRTIGWLFGKKNGSIFHTIKKAKLHGGERSNVKSEIIQVECGKGL